MSSRNPAFTITVAIAKGDAYDPSEGRHVAEVSVLGPGGRWSGALNLRDRGNLQDTVAELVCAEIEHILDANPEEWPQL